MAHDFSIQRTRKYCKEVLECSRCGMLYCVPENDKAQPFYDYGVATSQKEPECFADHPDW